MYGKKLFAWAGRMQADTDSCGLDGIIDTCRKGLYRGSPDQLVKLFHNLSNTISPWKLTHAAVQKEIKTGRACIYKSFHTSF